jgi:hypothetical protein
MKPPHLIPRLAYSTRQELKNAKALEARGGLDPRVPETSRCEHISHHLMAPRIPFLAALVESASSRSSRRPFSSTKTVQLGEQTSSRFPLKTPSANP